MIQLFLVCEDNDQIWFLVKASSIPEAIEIARSNGHDPYFVVDCSLVTRVYEEEKILDKVLI